MCVRVCVKCNILCITIDVHKITSKSFLISCTEENISSNYKTTGYCQVHRSESKYNNRHITSNQKQTHSIVCLIIRGVVLKLGG